jgi:predicted RNA-binding Zn ribbon-like protein
MAGEIALASVQPGGRAPAPGELALVQAFLNTHYDLETSHGSEVLATPEALGRWLSDRGLLEDPRRASHRDLARALDLREALRDLARGGADAPAMLDELAAGAPVELRFVGGPGFVRAGSGGVPAAFGLLIAIAAAAMLDGTWRRLKICPGHDCDWAFYDHSRNMTGRWCSMSVCGGRAKARNHYHRRRAREARS